MSNIADQIKDSNIILTASPFSNIGRQDVLNRTVDVPATAYRMCNPPSHMSSAQYAPIGNSILRPGIPRLSAHEVSDDVSICPVILHPTKQLSSQVHMKSEALIKTIGFAPARSHMTVQPQSRILTSQLQRSIMESQNVSPLIITPTAHGIHTTNDTVPAKIVPLPPSPVGSHFSVINKSGSYDCLPEFPGIRQSMVSGTPPVYTQSDFARFPSKSYHHKSAILSPAVIHGPYPGNSDEPCLNIPNSQHVFKPIISPRPSILRKRDAEGVLRAQKNLIPILTKPDPEDFRSMDGISLSRNGYSETGGLQIESIMVPQMPEAILPQISALATQSIMVEISPRKKPRKQLLPVNQDSPFKIIGDEMEYVEDKLIKSEKLEEYPDEDVENCNDDCADGDAEDEADDDLDDDMDLDDDCPADDDYDDDDDDDDDDFGDGFDLKSDKSMFQDEVKAPANPVIDEANPPLIKPRAKRPTLLAGYNKPICRAHTHHFQRHTDYKLKESKKLLAEIQQNKKCLVDSGTEWRIQHLLDQVAGMIKVEEEVTGKMNELLSILETNVKDLKIRHCLIELVKDNLQRSKVAGDQLNEVNQQLTKMFEYKTMVEDVIDKICPNKELKKKCSKVFNKT